MVKQGFGSWLLEIKDLFPADALAAWLEVLVCCPQKATQCFIKQNSNFELVLRSHDYKCQIWLGDVRAINSLFLQKVTYTAPGPP